MNLQPDEKLLKWYLLGATSPEEDAQIERNIRDEGIWRDELLHVEEDLIDDYACGALPAYERQLFEENFLDSAERRQKLLLAQAALNYAYTYGLAEAAAMRQSIQATGERETGEQEISSTPAIVQESGVATPKHNSGRRDWWTWLFAPAWKPALLAVLFLAAGIGIWRLIQGELEVRRGLAALKQAYSTTRPLEARITALNYATFSQQRGGERTGSGRDENTRLAGELAERILLDAVSERPGSAARHALGRLYLMKKEFDKAIDQFEEALKSDPNNTDIHSDFGAALLEKATFERPGGLPGSSETMLANSLKYLNKALELDGALHEARFNRALLYQSLGLPQQAMEDWRKYLEGDANSRWAEEARRNLKALEGKNKKISTNKDDLYRNFLEAWRNNNEENAWLALRRSFFRNGNYITEKLVDVFLESSINGRRDEANDKLQALSYAGDLLKRRGDDSFIYSLARYYGKATESQFPILSSARKLAAEGYDFYIQSKNDQAIAAYSQAKRLFEQSGNSIEALFMELWVGNSCILIPDIKRSRISFTQVASVSKGTRFHWLHAAALNGLTNTYFWLNEYSKAEDSYQQAQTISTRIGDDNGVLRNLFQYAGLKRKLHKYNESLKLVEQGLTLSREISAEASQTTPFYSIGAGNFIDLGLYEAAIEYEKEAVRLAKEMNNPLVATRCYVRLGMLYTRLENYTEAINSIKYGLEIGRSVHPEAIAQDLINFVMLHLGIVYRKAGLLTDSARALAQAADFYEQKKTEGWLYTALKEKLLTNIAQGDVVTVREELSRTFELFEKHRAKILEQSNRNSFFGVEQTVYDVAINFAFSQLKDPLKALEYSELSRARSLLDAVKTRGQLIGTENTPDIRFSNTSKPISPAEIQRLMPEKAQILEYAILEDGIIIWLISKSKLESTYVKTSSKELTEKLTQYLNRISNRNDYNATLALKAADELYDILILPVERMLDKDKVICIVPDKILCLLPFETLFSLKSEKYLLEDYSIIYASSANLFLYCTEIARKKSGARPEELLSVGNPLFDRQLFPELPDLPAATIEAVKIADSYPIHSVFVNDKAVKAAILQGLKDSDVVHLALHYVPNPLSPMLSQIPLAPVRAGGKKSGGVLTAYEIYNLKRTRTRLIVLAACQTRAEAWFNGEGPVDLSRIFLAAGIPLTVASLWPVEDSRATTELMINFHKARKSEGLSTVESLRKAKLTLLKGSDTKYQHPFYWAPFTVTGGFSEF
jgi:CHAT domain-containing protein/tetratricopeptide (TPR) repeat protein